MSKQPVGKTGVIYYDKIITRGMLRSILLGTICTRARGCDFNVTE